VRRVQWQHVGAGKGAYERVDNFKFVGKGQGDHNEELSRACCSCSKWSRCCCCLLLVLLLFSGLYAAVATLLVPEAPKPWFGYLESVWTSAKLPSLPPLPSFSFPSLRLPLPLPTSIEASPEKDKGYDCKKDHSEWKHKWSLEKKDWCCRYHGKGCPPDHHYDCEDGLKDWEHKWEVGKKHFCCGYDLEGCKAPAASSDKHEDAEDKEEEEEEDEGKKDEKKTTTTEEAKEKTTTTLYDCEYKLQEWEKEWSPPKKDYCCKAFDFGCSETTTPVPHDCEKDLDSWEHDWSEEKKDWCCKHEHACMSTKGNRDQGKSTTDKPSEGSKSGCDTPCKLKDVTATCKDRIHWVVNQPAPNGVRGKPHACEYALGLVLHDCSVCSVCSLAEAGCSQPVEDGEADYDCDGEDNAQSDWTPEQKDYCCQKTGFGCPPVPPVDNSVFHCNGDAAGWGEKENIWCCDHRELGCNS